MMLIRLMDDVTLGPGITHSIPIRRPILLLGMVSAPTSVDMGMVVNQLNVTPPFGQITWQGLVLENLAPGESVTRQDKSVTSVGVTPGMTERE
jgi:hypothetical protein